MKYPFRPKTPKANPNTVPGYIVTPITIFPDIVKSDIDNRAVKTNLTIPAWLKELAEAEGVNYSKIFQNALMEYLNVKK